MTIRFHQLMLNAIVVCTFGFGSLTFANSVGQASHDGDECAPVVQSTDQGLVSSVEQDKNNDSLSLEKVDHQWEDFPRGMTSFGAANVGGRIFVMGGKSGRAHAYAKSYQNRNVYCLNIAEEKSSWQTVGECLGLQGLAIVGHGGMVYRIGGLEARNKEGDPQELHSTAAVHRFDPGSQEWKEMPELPEARSSLDACVVGDKVYVVGGWKMDGENSPVWASDMLCLDLSQPDSKWKSIDTPFRTRALAVRGWQGKLVVVGGIQKQGGTTAAVHLFDLESQKWSEGPEVPTDGSMKAFGCSAVGVGKHLLVSTYDGGVYRLSDDAKSWTSVHQLEGGRFFHQMLPISDTRFAMVGGSHMESGSYREIEVFRVVESDKDASGSKEPSSVRR